MTNEYENACEEAQWDALVDNVIIPAVVNSIYNNGARTWNQLILEIDKVWEAPLQEQLQALTEAINWLLVHSKIDHRLPTIQIEAKRIEDYSVDEARKEPLFVMF